MDFSVLLLLMRFLLILLHTEELWACWSFWKYFWEVKVYFGWFPLVDRDLYFLFYPCWRIASLETVFFPEFMILSYRKGFTMSVLMSCDESSLATCEIFTSVRKAAKSVTTYSTLWSTFSFIFQRFPFLCFICFLITYSLLSLVLRIRIVLYPAIHISFFQYI